MNELIVYSTSNMKLSHQLSNDGLVVDAFDAHLMLIFICETFNSLQFSSTWQGGSNYVQKKVCVVSWFSEKCHCVIGRDSYQNLVNWIMMGNSCARGLEEL